MRKSMFQRVLQQVLGLSVLALSAGLPAAQAQTAGSDYPSKPIRLVVTFPPGGSTDAVVRLIAPRLAEKLGQQVVVDNRPGAGGNIGLAVVAKADADGHTLGIGAAGGLAANVSLYAKMPFDPIKDFAPISLLAHIPFVLVAHPGLPAKDLAEMLAQGQAAPGRLAVGHGGNGTAMHLSVQLLKQMAKVDLSEIAYKGSGPAAMDALGGQVPLAMLDVPSALQHIQAGKLKALAVTGSERLSFLPGVPTMAEAGVPGYESTGWFGMVAPAATPAPVLAKVQAALAAVMADPQVQRDARAAGVDLTPMSAAVFDRFIRSETAKWANVIKTSGTRLE
jgi:tripartite-type tricarboxylate transporter receptor subunit TctC